MLQEWAETVRCSRFTVACLCSQPKARCLKDLCLHCSSVLPALSARQSLEIPLREKHLGTVVFRRRPVDVGE